MTKGGAGSQAAEPRLSCWTNYKWRETENTMTVSERGNWPFLNHRVSAAILRGVSGQGYRCTRIFRNLPS